MPKPFYTRSIPDPLLAKIRREARQCETPPGAYMAAVLDELTPGERLVLYQRAARSRLDAITQQTERRSA